MTAAVIWHANVEVISGDSSPKLVTFAVNFGCAGRFRRMLTLVMGANVSGLRLWTR